MRDYPLWFASLATGVQTTRAVCKAAGVTSPTLYHHFGDKDGLALALVRQGSPSSWRASAPWLSGKKAGAGIPRGKWHRLRTARGESRAERKTG